LCKACPLHQADTDRFTNEAGSPPAPIGHPKHRKHAQCRGFENLTSPTAYIETFPCSVRFSALGRPPSRRFAGDAHSAWRVVGCRAGICTCPAPMCWSLHAKHNMACRSAQHPHPRCSVYYNRRHQLQAALLLCLSAAYKNRFKVACLQLVNNVTINIDK
jgi:hypothetical protein